MRKKRWMVGRGRGRKWCSGCPEIRTGKDGGCPEWGRQVCQKDQWGNEQLFVLGILCWGITLCEHDFLRSFPAHSPSFSAISWMISTKVEGFESLCLHQWFFFPDGKSFPSILPNFHLFIPEPRWKRTGSGICQEKKRGNFWSRKISNFPRQNTVFPPFHSMLGLSHSKI